MTVNVLTCKHLHHNCLPNRVVDLAFVIVKDAVRFVGKLGLVVSGLCNDNWALVLLLDLLLLERLAVVIETLADNYTTRVTGVCESKLVLGLVNRNYSAAAKAYIKASLLLQSRLAV